MNTLPVSKFWDAVPVVLVLTMCSTLFAAGGAWVQLITVREAVDDLAAWKDDTSRNRFTIDDARNLEKTFDRLIAAQAKIFESRIDASSRDVLAELRFLRAELEYLCRNLAHTQRTLNIDAVNNCKETR